MPKNVYSEINLHMTWHTKNDDPVLTAEIENRVHHYLENKIRETKNVIFHAVGVRIMSTSSPKFPRVC
jgi:putative transposase